MFGYILCSIRRRKAANLVTVGISVMLVILLHLYFGSIRSYKEQLNDLAQGVPVYCRIVNRNGTLDKELFIPQRTLNDLKSSDHVKDLAYVTRFRAGEGDFRLADLKNVLKITGIGVNCMGALGEDASELIDMEKADIEELLTSDRMECIADKTIMRRRGWKVGDTVVLKCYYEGADSEFNKRELHPMGGTVEVKIVGSMTGVCTATGFRMDVLHPYNAVLGMYQHFGHPCFADSATFYVQDPLQINAFKEQMKEYGLIEIIPTALDSYIGCALEVRDDNFITSATSLRRSIEMLEMFFPVICALVLMIGYVVSYLSGNSRRE